MSSSTAAEESGEEKSKPVMTTTSSSSNKSVTTTEIASANKLQSTEKSENNVGCDKNSEKKHKKRVTFRATPETSDQCKVKHVYNPNYDGPLTSIIKKESLKYPILVYKSNCIVRPSRLTEIVKNTANNIDKLNSLKFGREYANQQHANTTTVTDDIDGSELSPSSSSSSSTTNVIVASKFNLPKISTNSSRIIKPNKRFLDSPDECASTSKKKVIKASFWGGGGEDETLADKKTATTTNNSNNNSFGFNFVDELDFKSKKSKSKKDPKTSPTSILRKPVLQLSTTFGLFGTPQSNDGAIKSPFSLKLNSSSSSHHISSSIFTTSLVCHVCNSITTRKQPRKYGAVCCDLCRKFMSRMIEKVNKNPACSFQCDKSDGELRLSFFWEI